MALIPAPLYEFNFWFWRFELSIEHSEKPETWYCQAEDTIHALEQFDDAFPQAKDEHWTVDWDSPYYMEHEYE